MLKNTAKDGEEPEKHGYEWKNPPLFQNDQLGIAGWPGKDKDGNIYLRISLPLVENFTLFINDNQFPKGLKEDFNKLVEKYE